MTASNSTKVNDGLFLILIFLLSKDHDIGDHK